MDYARYLETLEDTENAPGCEQCTNNRLLLERVWQVRCPIWSFDVEQAHWQFTLRRRQCTTEALYQARYTAGLCSSACMFPGVQRGASRHLWQQRHAQGMVRSILCIALVCLSGRALTVLTHVILKHA